MRYSKIKRYDISNGLGLRTSIFFQGCNFHCPLCFNSELWDFNGGKPFNDEAKEYLFSLLADDHCKGLSILGGEPLQQNLDEMVEFLNEVREKFPTKDIWIWSGNYMTDLNEAQRAVIDLCDYFIDGRFVSAQSNRKLLFRGSENQTIWHNLGDGTWERSEYNDKR